MVGAEEGIGPKEPVRLGRLRAGAAWRRFATFGVVTIAFLCVLAGSIPEVRQNFHQTARGRAYRCGQMAPVALKARVKLHHIRSIVNLRGYNPGQAWYEQEHAVAQDAGVAIYDVALSSESAPTSGQLRELVRIYSTCAKPVLIHCESGLDRTGLGAAIYLLCEEPVSIDRAEQQMGLRYGMPPWRERTRRHRAFFSLYRAWLDEHQREHGRDNFFYWATHVYERPEQLGGGPDWPTANHPR